MAKAIKAAIYIRVSNPTFSKTLAATACHTSGTKFCFPSQNYKPNKNTPQHYNMCLKRFNNSN